MHNDKNREYIHAEFSCQKQYLYIHIYIYISYLLGYIFIFPAIYNIYIYTTVGKTIYQLLPAHMNFQDLVGVGHLKPGSLEQAFGQVVDADSPSPGPAPEDGSNDIEIVAPTNRVSQEVDPKSLQVEEISHFDPNQVCLFLQGSFRV